MVNVHSNFIYGSFSFKLHINTICGKASQRLHDHLPTGIFMCKVDNKNTRAMCEICSKISIKIP